MARPIFDLCDEYVTRAALLDPVWATMRGIGGSVGAATDFGPEGVAARAELIGEMLRRLARLEPSTEEDRAAADFLGDRLGAERDWYDSGEPLRLVRAPFGPIGTIRDSVDLLPRDSEEAWRAVTARLSAVPVMLASWRAALAVGLQRGLVGARRQAVESAAQADRYVGLDDAPPTHDAVVEAYGEGPLRAELAGAARAAHAAYAETARHLREEYAPRATEADGVGAERHALARRLVLGADIDPIEAYDWGWAELRRIEEEVAAEADRVRPDASLAEAVAVLDETEYVEGADAYREWLQEQHDRAIEQLHGVHFDIAAPLRRVEVTLAVGSSAGSAYYTPPSEDFTRPGRTWWPLGGRDRFAVWSGLTTVFHEGVPGHHLQLGQARVVGERLSRFSRVSGVSGHAEGWALYAERLADDLGWFVTPGQRLGMLKRSAPPGWAGSPKRCAARSARTAACEDRSRKPATSPTSRARGRSGSLPARSHTAVASPAHALPWRSTPRAAGWPARRRTCRLPAAQARRAPAVAAARPAPRRTPAAIRASAPARRRTRCTHRPRPGRARRSWRPRRRRCGRTRTSRPRCPRPGTAAGGPAQRCSRRGRTSCRGRTRARSAARARSGSGSPRSAAPFPYAPVPCDRTAPAHRSPVARLRPSPAGPAARTGNRRSARHTATRRPPQPLPRGSRCPAPVRGRCRRTPVSCSSG